jgi:hypothetical protein
MDLKREFDEDVLVTEVRLLEAMGLSAMAQGGNQKILMGWRTVLL